MKSKISGSIRGKMMYIFTILIGLMGMGLIALFMMIFWYGYSSLSQTYLQDVNRQTTNNLENNIQKIEDIHVKTLSSQTIQNQLRSINERGMDSYRLQQCQRLIERELAVEALYASYVVSVSVISLDGTESSVKKMEIGGTLFGFSEEEIYEANGTTLWGLAGDEGRICSAKAILDLKTMQPIGYINIIYENSYFGEILKDISQEYSGASYLVDEKGIITVTNREEFLGEEFPLDVESLREFGKARYDMLSNTQAFYYVGSRMPNGWVLVQTVSTREFNRRLQLFLWITVGVVLVVLVISFFCIRLATSRITQPTQELVKSMKTLGKDDKYPRVKVVTKDEIGMIGTEYNKMAENIETLIEKVYKMELTQKQAELEFLQMQINPHFLYNALDTISWMALEKGDMDISEMTIALAELLRATIQKESFISLEEEMKTVKDYLLIQKERFGEKVSVHYEVDQETLECQVPNFILQPLIENAIIHGLEPKIGKGMLNISVQIQDERLFFVIEDDGVGMDEKEIFFLYQKCRENDTKKSIGLKNVYRRLLLCYGEGSLLQIEGKKGEGTRVSFSIPAVY